MVPTWALLVGHRPVGSTHDTSSIEERRLEIDALVKRALSVASPERICALVEPQFLSDWRDAAPDVPPYNLWIEAANVAPLKGLLLALRAIRGRETVANVILIPADHCAAVETAWITSARGAVQLSATHRDTVYLLHDQVEGGSQPFLAESELCSSTVVVGSVDSLIELCEGNSTTQVLDLMTEHPSDDSRSSPSGADNTQRPINIVHVRSIEEYGRIQTGRYTRSASLIDITA